MRTRRTSNTWSGSKATWDAGYEGHQRSFARENRSAVPRNRRRSPGRAVDVDRVLSAFPQELASMLFEVADQVDSFHVGGRANDSRMTSEPSMACSAKARFASRTRATASFKFSRASSRVSPCVFAPGSSSMKATYPSGTFMKTAVSPGGLRFAFIRVYLRLNEIRRLDRQHPHALLRRRVHRVHHRRDDRRRARLADPAGVFVARHNVHLYHRHLIDTDRIVVVEVL